MQEAHLVSLSLARVTKIVYNTLLLSPLEQPVSDYF